MTQPPHQSGPTPAYGAPGAPARTRRRPRVIWWVLGVVLLLLAGIAFAAGLFLTLRPLLQESAVFTADGNPVRLDLPADDEQGVYVRPGTAVECEITDEAGRPVELRTVTGQYSYNEWVAVQRFDTGDGNLVARCTGSPAGAGVRIGGLPSVGHVLGGTVITILVPLLLGLLGLVVLVVTAIRWFTASPDPGARP